MMRLAEALAEKWPIQYEGHKVWMMFRIPIQQADVFKLKWVQWSSTVRRGVNLGIPGVEKKRYIGEFLIAGQRIKAPQLWVDTAPGEVEFTCLPKEKVGSLGIWNIWEGKWGTDFWLGDAGLYVETPSDNTWIFHCSDGLGGAPFTDLVFELKRIQASSQTGRSA